MEPARVRIFSPDMLPRLDYIAEVIMGDILGIEWEVVTERNCTDSSPVINYSDEDIRGAFKVKPVSLLSEKGVRTRDIEVSQWDGVPVFFQTGGGSDFPFDIFAASFWLLTRYEEYLPFEPDRHGRFMASSSLAFRNGFLDRPVIDLWAGKLGELLQKKFPALVFRKKDFRPLLTVDIDIPWAYKGRSMLRHMGGILSDLAGRPRSVAERFKVVAGTRKDPNDVFDYIIENIRKTGSEARFFFSVGDHSVYDKNPSWENEEYRKLIRNISSEFDTGLHPSYHAASRPGLIKSEVCRLNEITGREVTASRFHYLRISFPESFRDLAGAGITEDYSLCFHDEPGFRAGIARPFIFYDLDAEKLTGLRIIPFQVMDVTLFLYRKLDPEAAFDAISKLYRETRNVGGLFVSLWHNTSLPETPYGKEWRKVFESMLKTQQE